MVTYTLRSTGYCPSTVFETLEEARAVAQEFAREASKNILIIEHDEENTQVVDEATFVECYLD